MTLIVNEIISEGGFTATTANITSISTSTYTISTTPTNNDANTEILSRNSSTGNIEYKDVSTFASSNGKIIGLTQIMYIF
jgi:hypothetical protein